MAMQMDKWKDKIRELCGIDIRSLAIFRMGLALVLLFDLCIRAQDITAHYTDEGVFPRDLLISNFIDTWNISLHLMNGTWQFQLFLFFLAAVFGFALLVGYKTRLAMVLSWILLISLQTRNPLVLQGGDIVLRLLAFWGMFLPLGAYWSVDQKLNKQIISNPVVSIGSLALLLQVCFIYWFTAMLKWDPTWRVEGTAVWYSLSIQLFSTPLGLVLLQYPQLLKTLTFTTFYLEAFGPFFAFSPIWTAPLRFLTAISFILFHLLGLNLTMELGHFSYVCAVAWLVFLPTQFWDIILQSKIVSTSFWIASRLSNVLAAFFITCIFLWNVITLGVRLPYIPPYLNTIGTLFRIDQYWNMFSPYPLKEDGWFVIPGKLRDGSEVNLFTNGGPVDWQKPALVSATFPNDRWRSYMMNLLYDDQSDVDLLYYANYLCQQWNESHPFEKQLMTFDIDFMSRINTWMGPPEPYKKLVLWEHHCFDKRSRSSER